MALFHSNLLALQADIAAEAAAAYRNGIRFFVTVENAAGEWFALHADDQGHAGALARSWVDVLGCRGADCFRLFPWGPAPAPFYQYLEDPAGPDFYDNADTIEGALA